MRPTFMMQFIIGITLVASAALAQAEAPRLLPFQGRLTDPSGNPITDGAKLIQFQIWDSPTGGNVLWPGEAHRATINGGLVNVVLGTKNPLPTEQTARPNKSFFDQPLYLQITGDANGDQQITAADPLLLPRQAILPVLFAADAAHARNSDKLAGYDWSALFGVNNPVIGKLEGSRIVPFSITTNQLDPSVVGQLPALHASITNLQFFQQQLLRIPLISDSLDFFNRIGTNGSVTISSLNLVLAPIPAGQFLMGSPANEQDRNANERPQTQVTLTKLFWMGKYEVTQRQYLTIRGSNPSFNTSDLDLPAEQMAWDQANSFCSALTQTERSTGRLPYGYVYRLLTEAEWEYACRAGTTARFSWGEDPGYINAGTYGWFTGNSGGLTHRVGGRTPNNWGLYDMNGNVFEWCLDYYRTYRGGSVTDPKGPLTGANRVVRGGAWDSDSVDLRSAVRGSNPPNNYDNSYGFRIVLASEQ